MKEQDIKLTVQEVEELCRLYMDCRLSVLEETELQYILGKLPYSTPLINDVRAVMGIRRVPATATVASSIKSGWLRRRSILSIAASLTLLLGLGFAVINKPARQAADDAIYIAYANGQEVGREQAIRQIKADMEQADALMDHIAELEARELATIDELTNLAQLNQ
ncbi:MAG: hypothetical protein K2M00_07700 [Muribaculaceae bacterium]|nr:hypothetical protein [Muribaculaceae bacterium]